MGCGRVGSELAATPASRRPACSSIAGAGNVGQFIAADLLTVATGPTRQQLTRERCARTSLHRIHSGLHIVFPRDAASDCNYECRR